MFQVSSVRRERRGDSDLREEEKVPSCARYTRGCDGVLYCAMQCGPLRRSLYYLMTTFFFFSFLLMAVARTFATLP